MIKLGRYNNLKVSRVAEFGLYLTDGTTQPDGKLHEVLLPAKYVPDHIRPGDEIRVFVYNDSEERPVATTEKPFATVGQFAYLQCVDVNKYGAFLDWGVVKQLLCPFSEQKIRMHTGGVYLVYVYLDDKTNRIVASARVEHFLGNVYPEYRQGQRVHVLITGRTDIGYTAIVDNLHRGMIYANEVYAPLELESQRAAYVKSVRDDGKIDLTLTVPGTGNRVDHLGHKLLELIERDSFPLTDKSTPEEVAAVLHCSKKDYKKAIGALYRTRRVALAADGTWHKA